MSGGRGPSVWQRVAAPPSRVTRVLEVDLPAPVFKASQDDLVLVQSSLQGAPRLMLPVCGRVSGQDEFRSAICVPSSARPGLLGGWYPSGIDLPVSGGGRSCRQ